MVRSRDKARKAALRAEVVALRATVAELRAELAWMTRAAATATEAAEAAEAATTADTEPGWVTLRMPLVQLALGDPAGLATGPDVATALATADRSADTVRTEIVLEPAPAPADRLAWSVLAHLPERRLLDPKADRDQQPRDLAHEVAEAASGAPHRRSA